MSRWLHLLAFAACGGTPAPPTTPPTTTPPTTTPPTSDVTKFDTVADFTKAVASLEGKPVEVTGRYLNSQLQNAAGAVSYTVTLVDDKDSLSTTLTCHTTDEIPHGPFTLVWIKGTVRDSKVVDCAVTLKLE